MSPTADPTASHDGETERACWCGHGRLRRVRLGGVTYLTCAACGGELGDATVS